MASKNKLGRNDNSMAERRLRPIYGTPVHTPTVFSPLILLFFFFFSLPEWIDNGNYKKALHELDKLIKKSPNQNCSKVRTCIRCLSEIWTRL